jgi:hypothetical protein
MTVFRCARNKPQVADVVCSFVGNNKMLTYGEVYDMQLWQLNGVLLAVLGDSVYTSAFYRGYSVSPQHNLLFHERHCRLWDLDNDKPSSKAMSLPPVREFRRSSAINREGKIACILKNGVAVIDSSGVILCEIPELRYNPWADYGYKFLRTLLQPAIEALPKTQADMSVVHQIQHIAHPIVDSLDRALHRYERKCNSRYAFFSTPEETVEPIKQLKSALTQPYIDINTKAAALRRILLHMPKTNVAFQECLRKHHVYGI